MRALFCPGQGSQRVGMGKELYERFDVARATFEEANEVLGFSLSNLCFEGPAEKLNLTENTQPAILCTSIAALRSLQAQHEVTFDVAMGHSLGEWSALVAAGALEFADAVRLVRLRGKAMQEAVSPGVGAMAAILGMDASDLVTVCEDVSEAEVCQVANMNGGGQVVISGHADAVQRACTLAKERGAKRAIPLKVSAPFHCALMEPAAQKVAVALEEIHVSPGNLPVVANIDANPHESPDEIKNCLVKQVAGTVRWEQSLLRVQEMGVTEAVEVGHGKVLAGLAKRVVPEISVKNVGNHEDIQNWSEQ